MKKHLLCVVPAAMVIGVWLAGTGCDRSARSSTGKSKTTTEAPASSLAELSGLLLTEAPADAAGPAQARRTAKPGDRIVLFGEIGGRKIGTFDGELAIFFLADPAAIVNCMKKHAGGDGCPTPWDYCCTPKEEVTAALALIQVRSPATGQVLAHSLKGWNGLTELSQVTVAGTVDAASSPAALVVNLDGIFIHRQD